MQGRQRMYRHKQNRVRWCKACRKKPATYRRANGETAADDEHDLCHGCFKEALQKSNKSR
jgi:superfamily II helicase